MFQDLTAAPEDPILGLFAAYRRDPAPHKINLGAGVYQDETGATPVLATVRAAERRLLAEAPSKNYLAIDGLPGLVAGVGELVLGPASEAAAAGRLAGAQTPGGTAALRVAADLVHAHRSAAAVWVSSPTWVNHRPVFESAGLAVREYPWVEPGRQSLALDAALAALDGAAPGDLVVLHGCCHNPTGIDPDGDEWEEIARRLAERRLLPVLDCAYQGFGAGLEADAAPARLLAARLPELIVCVSFSKTMGLYGERVGALLALAGDREAARAVASRIKRAIRSHYSNPPAHGGRIAELLLADPELNRRWRGELEGMRRRVAELRRLLAAELDARSLELTTAGNGFLGRQRGLFSMTGLTAREVEALRRRHSIYLVGSGRINVAGVTAANVGRLSDALAGVLAER